MRARMALKLAGIEVEIREISLREKPAHMLQVSPKATVPVLILPDGMVIDESLEIMFWAFSNMREKNDALQANIHELSRACDLITENDGSFKRALDAYKYPERHPNKTQAEYREQGEVFLQKLESLLSKNNYLFDAQSNLADIAIFPFIRQFAAVDSDWFEASSYSKLQTWLNGWVSSDLFKSIMKKHPTFVG
jgi:glutathione S-transferase